MELRSLVLNEETMSALATLSETKVANLKVRIKNVLSLSRNDIDNNHNHLYC